MKFAGKFAPRTRFAGKRRKHTTLLAHFRFAENKLLNVYEHAARGRVIDDSYKAAAWACSRSA
eukprot:6186131-Pleurochrysis_carterae.AAC.1